MIQHAAAIGQTLPAIGRAVAILGLIVGLPYASVPAAAAGLSGVYVVTGIAVDAAPRDGGSARDAARAAGEQTAYRRLLERLTQPADWARLPTLDIDAINNQLIDYEVLEEHSSAQRYLGDYLFRFNPKGPRQVLKNAGIPYIELASHRVALLPRVTAGDAAADAAWRAAWGQFSGDYGLVPWRVVSSGASGQDTTLAADPVAALSAQGDGGDVVVAAATPAPDMSHLDVAVTRYRPDGSSETDAVAIDAPRNGQSIWRAGVVASVTALETRWKAAAAAGGVGTESTVELAVPLTNVTDWGVISRKLSRVVLVHGMTIEAMTRREVRLTLVADATPQALRTAFAQEDLDFTPGTPAATLELRTGALRTAPMRADSPGGETGGH